MTAKTIVYDSNSPITGIPKLDGETAEVATAGTDYIDTLSRVNTTSAKLTMRPTLIGGRVGANSKPTPVTVGAHAGYSLPIFNADAEDLFFRDYIPGRWDGASNIICTAICCLVATQTGGVKKYFKLQLSWENQPSGGVITAGTHDLTNNVECAVNEAQYTLHYPTFTIPYNSFSPNISASDHLGLRLMRIAADGTAITDEVIVLDVLLTYDVNKIFKSAT